MPKKTKNFAKTSKQVKSTMLKRVDWGSRKVQLLLVVLVFVLIGGVYYVYQSSANSPIAREMSTAIASRDMHIVDKTSGNKKNQTVTRLGRGQLLTWRPKIWSLQNKSHLVCVLARSDKGKPSSLSIRGLYSRSISNSTNYEEICYLYNGYPGNRLNAITFQNTGNNPVYLGVMAVKQL